MKKNISRGRRCCLVCLCVFVASHANPLPPAPPLSEIRVIDNNHWFVEVDGHLLNSPLRGPCSTDTFTLYCSQQSVAPSAETMRTCMMPEQVDSNGIALLSPQQFPSLQFVKGSYVFLGLKGQSGTGTVWSAQIPWNLDSTSSIITSYIESCCQMMPDGSCGMNCGSVTYTISACPSIGVRNGSAYGSILGYVRDADSLPLNNIIAHCTSIGEQYITSSGSFSFGGLIHCQTYSLSFTDINEKPISDTVIGPLSVTMGRTLTVNIRLNYKKPTAVVSSGKTAASHNKIRFLKTGIGQRIVLAITETSSKGTIDLFSADGKCIRSMPLNCDNPGTYTIEWDGYDNQHMPAGAGKYVCRVQINGETVGSGLIIK